MANVAYLLNTPNLVNDISTLEGKWLGIASKVWRIPASWFFMFEYGDLAPCVINYTRVSNADDELVKSIILNPAASVESVIERLRKSLQHFELLAGDREIGLGYWNSTIRSLEELPFDYVTIDATEILLMSDIHKSANIFSEAFRHDESDFHKIKLNSGFRDGTIPCSLDCYLELKDKDLRFPVDNIAATNADAIEGGFLESKYWIKSERSPERTAIWLAKLNKIQTDYSAI